MITGDAKLAWRRSRVLVRVAIAVVTVAALTVVFATSEGENIRTMAVPVAALYAGWWATGPVVVLLWARPASLAGAAWALGLAASFVGLRGLYDSTSSTSGIGLVTIPLGVAAASGAVVVVSRVVANRSGT